MRVLFVLQEIEDEQLGIMYLSGMLKSKGHNTGLVKSDYKSIVQKLKDGVPTVLAYSAVAFYVDYYLELNRSIKKDFDIFSVFGGHYPTGKPQILDEEGVDAVCVGEGELALLELVDHLSKGEEIRNIKNLWVKKDGKIYRNSLRPLMRNLDLLPFPDRSLFKIKSPFFYDRISMMTGRGCAYNCQYCYNSTYRRVYKTNNIYRRRSVNNVIEEIKYVQKNQKVKFILFYDDIFILMPEWIEDFSYKYKKEINIPFCCYVRINLVTPRIVRLLKEANCYSISFGLEAGNEHLRNSILSRHMNEEEIITKAKLFKDAGIKVRTTNIIGIPGGSLGSDIETLKLNIKCRVDFAKVSMFSVYPNTDFAVAQGDCEGFAKHFDFRPPKIVDILGKYSISASGHFRRVIHSLAYPQYGFKNGTERKIIGNLHKLFGITVSFPFLFPIVKLVIRLPNNSLFRQINFLWANYCSYFKLYCTCGWFGFLKRIIRHRKALT
jgi:radical SAM superfamily enzyme YgiQ (UPF0313 family)